LEVRQTRLLIVVLVHHHLLYHEVLAIGDVNCAHDGDAVLTSLEDAFDSVFVDYLAYVLGFHMGLFIYGVEQEYYINNSKFITDVLL
jgi:hypothetical protein